MAELSDRNIEAMAQVADLFKQLARITENIDDMKSRRGEILRAIQDYASVIQDVSNSLNSNPLVTVTPIKLAASVNAKARTPRATFVANGASRVQ